ncbi:cyanophycin synthetase [Chromatiales bacterium (ex Bugula neritina AB1)]|nr:cyanophycin synthetase [Chromatiales bacterium (ex Bugula neritina AB1)]
MRKLKKYIYAWISERYMDGCSNYNSVEVRRGCRSKAQCRAVFAKNNVPHAVGMIFLWPWQAHAFARKHGFPLAIKPNVSGYSRGSYFPINDYKSLYKAIFWAKMWWPTTVIEQYLLGSNYRVLCTDNELISIIRRYPPFVTGNGVDSIDRLIDTENNMRAEMKLHPVIYPIKKNDQIKDYLKKKNLSLQSIPAKEESIELFHRVALAPGGVVETIDQKSIPEENKELFLNLVTMFGANVLGIDVIFEKGIETSYLQQKCIFIEVNSRPYMKMHYYPRYGDVDDLATALAKLDNLDIPDRDIF